MFDLVAVMRAAHFGSWVVGRRRVCIERAMDLIGLVVEVVAGGSLIVFVVCCWVACPVVGRVDFRTMIVLAVVEVVLRSMIVEVYLAYSAGSWAGSRVARWHTACCRILPYSAHLIQRHHRLEEVSSPGVRLVLGQVVLRDYMPLVQVDVTAAVAAVLAEERWPLLQTVPTLVVLGTNAPKPCFLLEDGSVSQWLSFPAVGLQDS